MMTYKGGKGGGKERLRQTLGAICGKGHGGEGGDRGGGGGMLILKRMEYVLFFGSEGIVVLI